VKLFKASALVLASLLVLGATPKISNEDKFFMHFLNVEGHSSVLNMYFPKVRLKKQPEATVDEIYSAFKAMCLETGFNAVKLAKVAELQYQSWRYVEIKTAKSRSASSFDLSLWKSDLGAVQIWNSDPNLFSKLPFYQVYGRTIRTGYVDKIKGVKGSNISPQCNSLFRGTQFPRAELVARISTDLQTEPVSANSNSKYLQAKWVINDRPNPITIGLYVTQRKAGDSIVHIGVVSPVTVNEET